MRHGIRASQMFPGTQRMVPGDASLRSHQLLLQAGFFDATTAGGVYWLGPLGLRVLQKVEAIVRAEMDAAGGQEMVMPILQERGYWEETGRWTKYQHAGIMFTTKLGEKKLGEKKLNETEFGLAPTAEEMVTAYTRGHLQSWRQLPLRLYQIGPKFRKEARPQGGLLRGLEFEMKDLYSFDLDEAGMRASFEAMRQAYTNCFTRMGFNFICVQADSGAIGGQGSAEFMAVCDAGMDSLLVCDQCGYGANQEKAVSKLVRYPEAYDAEQRPMRKEHTPVSRTVEDLEQLFGLRGHQMVKTIIFVVDTSMETERRIAVCCRGDLEINETKLRNLLGCEVLEIAGDEVVREVTGAEVGFAGPFGMKKVDQILFDVSTEGMVSFLCGCCETHYHLLDVNWGTDLKRPEKFYDLHNAVEGNSCAQCAEGKLHVRRGIELGHIFMLQDGYAKSMGVTFQDKEGKAQIPMMGCYGIGTTRCVQAAVEQHNDKAGIIWPWSIAPYHVVLVPVKYDDPDQQRLAEQLFAELQTAGYDVVLDDRTDRFGSKMADAELIGYPCIVVIGRGAKDGRVEFKNRATGEKQEIPAAELQRVLPRP